MNERELTHETLAQDKEISYSIWRDKLGKKKEKSYEEIW